MLVQASSGGTGEVKSATQTADNTMTATLEVDGSYLSINDYLVLGGYNSSGYWCFMQPNTSGYWACTFMSVGGQSGDAVRPVNAYKVSNLTFTFYYIKLS